jgi:RNA polymerase sigma-70 factor (ECF subfamily)
LLLSTCEEGAVDQTLRESGDLPEVSDEILLSRIVQEDREALAALFRRYFRLVHGIGRRILHNNAEAEDLAHDVFLFIARKSHLYNPEKGTARSWIVRVTYYQALDRREYLETRHYYSSVSLDASNAEEMAGAEGAEYDHSGEALFGRSCWLECRNMLTEDQWETIRLHFYEGCTFTEIGQKRNLTVGNVRHHFYRGLARLRKHIFHDKLRGY